MINQIKYKTKVEFLLYELEQMFDNDKEKIQNYLEKKKMKKFLNSNLK